ncbi:MAG: rod shape-determining protein RodA [Chthonomonadales bacterium]|nr:rod shape-determining protein RodA [Chthonomonadales bacterium]
MKAMTVPAATAFLDRRLTKRFDVPLALLTLSITALGLAALHTIEVDGALPYFRKQLAFALVGLIVMVSMALLGHERFQRHLRAVYVLNLVLLAAVLITGHEAKGSVRWFAISQFRLQPSELAKLFIILTLSTLFYRYRERIDRPVTVVRSLAHIAVPLILILKQPDLGTTLAIGGIWFGMAFIAGVPLRYLAVVVLCAVALFGLMVKLSFVRDYQLQRLLVFVNPSNDPRGAGYQVNQARIAIGSGRVFGKGLGRGTQSQGEFIPERQTDFIFTVIAEEGGFLLSTITVVLYAALVLRGWHLVAHAGDELGRNVGAGVLSMITFHGLVNMAMNVGLGPVTGVPLPLVSYGGSSLIVTMAGIGLLLGIGMRRDPLVF